MAPVVTATSRMVPITHRAVRPGLRFPRFLLRRGSEERRPELLRLRGRDSSWDE